MSRFSTYSRPALSGGLVAVLLAFAVGPIVLGAQDEAPEGVVNYTRVDATVACAGATPAEAMPAIKALGFASVINFRTAEEEGANIGASQSAATAAGLTYIHIPFRAPSDETTEEFLSAIADSANQPAYIHCASANRVGAMWFIKRVKQDGWAQDRAMAEAEGIGLRSERLKEFAVDYVTP
ncbi:MAG: sulfur transferase domain-containing protein [Acidimicrobiales bacterium]